MDALSRRIGAQRFNAWFRHGARLSVQDDCIKVSVPNPFVAKWIEGHFLDDIAAAVESLAGRRLPVNVLTDPSLVGQLRKSQRDNQAELVARAGQPTRRSAAPTSGRR